MLADAKIASRTKTSPTKKLICHNKKLWAEPGVRPIFSVRPLILGNSGFSLTNVVETYDPTSTSRSAEVELKAYCNDPPKRFVL